MTLVFKDWAHNNVKGKKGFQPKTPLAKTILRDVVQQSAYPVRDFEARVRRTPSMTKEGAYERGIVETSAGEVIELDERLTPHVYAQGRGIDLNHIPPEKLEGAVISHSHPLDGLSGFSPGDVAFILSSRAREIRAVSRTKLYSLKIDHDALESHLRSRNPVLAKIPPRALRNALATQLNDVLMNAYQNELFDRVSSAPGKTLNEKVDNAWDGLLVETFAVASPALSFSIE